MHGRAVQRHVRASDDEVIVPLDRDLTHVQRSVRGQTELARVHGQPRCTNKATT